MLTDYSCLCFCLPNEAFACHATVLFTLQVYQGNVMSKYWVTFSPGEKMYTESINFDRKMTNHMSCWAGTACCMQHGSINGNTLKNIYSASSPTLEIVIHILPIIYFSLLLNVLISSEFIVEWSAWGIDQFKLHFNDGQMLKVWEFLIDYYWNNLLKLKNKYFYHSSAYGICKTGIGILLSLWKNNLI